MSGGAAAGRPYLLFVDTVHLRCAGMVGGLVGVSNCFRLVGRRERIARDCHGRWLDTFLMERRCKDDEPSGYRKL